MTAPPKRSEMPTVRCGPRAPLSLRNGVTTCAACGGPPHRETPPVVAEDVDASAGAMAGVVYLALAVFAAGAIVWSVAT